jgi:hypothetical protein
LLDTEDVTPQVQKSSSHLVEVSLPLQTFSPEGEGALPQLPPLLPVLHASVDDLPEPDGGMDDDQMDADEANQTEEQYVEDGDIASIKAKFKNQNVSCDAFYF